MIVLSIDSSIVSIGYAIFDDAMPIDRGLLDSGTLRIPKMVESEKVRAIYVAIGDLLDTHHCDWAVIEKPERFPYMRSSNPYGRGKNLDSLRKNNIAVGTIAATCVSRGLEIELVTPQQWKGRQHKEVTRSWVNEVFGKNLQKKNYDECDAIKLGVWFIERQSFEQRTGNNN